MCLRKSTLAGETVMRWKTKRLVVFLFTLKINHRIRMCLRPYKPAHATVMRIINLLFQLCITTRGFCSPGVKVNRRPECRERNKDSYYFMENQVSSGVAKDTSYTQLNLSFYFQRFACVCGSQRWQRELS